METDDLLLFVRVAELRSLTAAGRDLRLTPAVVSSRLIRLEKKLGMRLLNRTTRQVDLTPDGHHFLQHSLNILEAVDQAQSAIAVSRDSPAGALKVSAPVSLHDCTLLPWQPSSPNGIHKCNYSWLLATVLMIFFMSRLIF